MARVCVAQNTQMAGFCKYGNDNLSATNRVEFLDELNDYKLLKQGRVFQKTILEATFHCRSYHILSLSHYFLLAARTDPRHGNRNHSEFDPQSITGRTFIFVKVLLEEKGSGRKEECMFQWPLTESPFRSLCCR